MAGDSPRDLNDAADASFAKGNYSTALEFYQKIIALNKTAGTDEKKLLEKAHFDAGRCFIEMGKPKEALEILSKILRNFPSFAVCEDGHIPHRVDLRIGEPEG